MEWIKKNLRLLLKKVRSHQIQTHTVNPLLTMPVALHRWNYRHSRQLEMHSYYIHTIKWGFVQQTQPTQRAIFLVCTLGPLLEIARSAWYIAYQVAHPKLGTCLFNFHCGYLCMYGQIVKEVNYKHPMLWPKRYYIGIGLCAACFLLNKPKI